MAISDFPGSGARKSGSESNKRNTGSVVSEMRIHFGPGYRVYFTRIGGIVYVLLCGGTKRGQQRDIAKALDMAKLLKE